MVLKRELSFLNSLFGPQSSKLKTCPENDLREVCYPKILFACDGD